MRRRIGALGVIICSLTSLALGLTASTASGGPGDSGKNPSPRSGGSVSAGPSGSQSLQVHVSTTYSTSGGGGGSSSTTVSGEDISGWVHPVCWYEPVWTGEELAKYMDRGDVHKDERRFGETGHYQRMKERYSDYKKYATDGEGNWHDVHCSSEYMPEGSELDEFFAYSDEYRKNHPAIYVPAGSTPPAPEIPATVLARVAWNSVTIPAPSVDYNPKMSLSGVAEGATIVGYDTWVWASGDTPTTVTVTATAGSASATITASASGMRLSAPDSTVSCRGFGVAWSPDSSSTDCSIVFTRSSAHLGGTTPLTTSITYSATWTSTTGESGDLGGVTTTSTTQIPVAEVQTLNTSDD